MCGIFGIVSDGDRYDHVKQALSEISYRGPDYSNIYHFENVIIGHNRLSIIDLDERSNQPFESDDKEYVIAYNGEVYNFKALRKALVNAGFSFRTESDTEVILLAFRKWGTACFSKFHGMFAFAIYSRKTGELILARDRFGEKPLFYNYQKNSFSFSSELTPLKRLIAHAEIDKTALIDYFHFGFIPAPKTIFAQIQKLEPGHFMRYSCREGKVLQAASYFNLEFPERLSKLSFAEKSERFSEIGDQVAREISIADVPLGVFLSGGVDSTGAAYFLKRSGIDISSFTAGFTSEKFDESAVAASAAEILGIKNRNRIVKPEDFSSLYENMIDHYGEPHNDFSYIPTQLICKEAAVYHKVMISGDGADEIFCGYPRYHKFRGFAAIKPIRPFTYLIATLSKALPKHSDLKRQINFIAKNEIDFFHSVMSMNFQPIEIDPVLGTELRQLSRSYSSRDIIASHLKKCGSDNLLQKLRYLDIKMTLSDDMLVKVDRASMANSIEVRPFYTHPLVSTFAFDLPIGDLVTLKHDKLFLKRFLSQNLPQKLLFRSKMGFVFPLRELITGRFRDFFNSCIDSLPQEVADKKQIAEIMALHMKGKRNFTAQLNSLMSLGCWMKKNMPPA